LAMLSATLHDHLVAVGARLGHYGGAETAASFGDTTGEFAALRTDAGIFDLGWRGMLVLTGSDRQRWLNGMVDYLESIQERT